MSLALQWKKRVENGETEPPATVGSSGPGGKGSVDKPTLMKLLDDALDVARKGLKSLRSKSDKVAHKKEKLIPEFQEYVDRLMDKGWAHDLLPWHMIWCLDAGLIGPALKVAHYCMEQGIQPDEEYFRRDIPTLVADLTHKWAEQNFKDGLSSEPYFSEVYELVVTSSGTDPWAQHDEVRAKYFKLKGLIEYEAGNLETAKDNFEKGVKVGATVKTVLAEVTKKLEDAKPAVETEERAT
ncbi:putative Small terminase subunit [Pseudodesulfovibrio profundus]|uniref:Putative Small terminase subunit n=1 Tax=Pseudodesulfovibrio profundus TaxID=57320 RepID=A0A2C8FD21_9BACT|nr:phage terminase small subunit [Pseudodesulfovibrio profundus]SOB60542.1 putative Small terminase subunit [Pseudodesulfovibrio profundus]